MDRMDLKDGGVAVGGRVDLADELVVVEHRKREVPQRRVPFGPYISST